MLPSERVAEIKAKLGDHPHRELLLGYLEFFQDVYALETRIAKLEEVLTCRYFDFIESQEGL